MYRISEFSRITMLTVKALRYYDEQQILKPSGRGFNNYRLYDEEDLKKAERIKLFKACGFTIAEIKKTLGTYKAGMDVGMYLEEKKKRILENIRREEETINRIEQILLEQKKEERTMSYEIKEVALDEVKVLAKEMKGSYQAVGELMQSLRKDTIASVVYTGKPFTCYDDEGYKEGDANFEVCFPVEENGKGIATKPAGRAISTIHTGGYEEIGKAYKALIDYAKDHGMELRGGKDCYREVYLTGPECGDKEKYETEVMMLIK